MAGPSGFETRKKGRTALAQCWVPLGGLYVGGTAVSASLSANDLSVNAGWATVSTFAAGGGGSTLPNSGISILNSTAISVYNLADPVAGVAKVITIQAGSSAVMIKTSTVRGVTIQGGSTTSGASTKTNVMSSTATLATTLIELYGVSSVAYQFAGVYPSTLSHLLFSTTT